MELESRCLRRKRRTQIRFRQDPGPDQRQLRGLPWRSPYRDRCSLLPSRQAILNYPQTATTGQVISAQKISESGVNLSDKADLNRSWDIHAERQLQCTDCHYALNNPAHADEAQKAEPDHLLYDPRTLEISEYLREAGPQLRPRPERAVQCRARTQRHHAPLRVLPRCEQGTRRLAALHRHAHGSSRLRNLSHPADVRACHPVLRLDRAHCSTDNPSKSIAAWKATPTRSHHWSPAIKPVLLNRTNIDGQKLLAPYNLITTYYWVYDDANGNKRPVRLLDLEAAYFENGTYAADIVSAFDANSDGSLSDDELVIDSSAKEEAVKAKLASLGLNNPRIEGLTQPYSINHNVTRGENAVNDCGLSQRRHRVSRSRSSWRITRPTASCPSSTQRTTSMHPARSSKAMMARSTTTPSLPTTRCTSSAPAASTGSTGSAR